MATKRYNCSTRTGRRTIPARSAAYTASKLAKGRTLKYRKRYADRPGFWQVEVLLHPGAGKRKYKSKVLGQADDNTAANGDDVLSFQQASVAASSYDPWDTADGVGGPAADPDRITVTELCELYREWYAVTYPRSLSDLLTAIKHIVREIGDIPVSKLTSRRIEAFKISLAERPRRYKGGYRAAQTTDEKQSRQSTANNNLIRLKALLNWGKRQQLITCSDDSWRWVEGFKNTKRYHRPGRAEKLENRAEVDLYLQEAMRVAPHYYDLSYLAITCGCRYSELRHLLVRHVRMDDRVLVIENSQATPTKTNRSRSIPLNDQTISFLSRLTEGRDGDDYLLTRTVYGKVKPWADGDQTRYNKRVCEASGLNVNFHCLRHSWTSLARMNGMNDLVLMESGGWSNMDQITKRYGKANEDFRHQQVKEHAPMIEPLMPADESDTVN